MTSFALTVLLLAAVSVTATVGRLRDRTTHVGCRKRRRNGGTVGKAALAEDRRAMLELERLHVQDLGVL